MLNPAQKKKRPHDERGGRYARVAFGPEHRATARAIFEARPGTTIEAAAREIGAATSTVRRWKSDASKTDQPWRAARHKAPRLSGRAGAIANQHRMRLAELGKAADDEQAQHEAAIATADAVAADLRAAVITRHRAEWAGPRRFIYEAMQAAAQGDLQKAQELGKLAKQAAETLQIVQQQERRSWGIDPAALGENAGKTVVVIERVNGLVM